MLALCQAKSANRACPQYCPSPPPSLFNILLRAVLPPALSKNARLAFLAGPARGSKCNRNGINYITVTKATMTKHRDGHGST